MKLVLKLYCCFRVSSIVIKLDRDALKELIETNSSKYEVATHLNVPLQDKLVHEPIVIKIEELVKSFHSDQQGEFIVEVVRCVWLMPALHSQAKPQHYGTPSHIFLLAGLSLY